MKKTVFLLLLFISTIIQAQTVPKQSRLAITQNVKQNNATRIVVQDSITKELNWVLKSNLISTLDQVLGVGNISTRSFTVGNVTGNYFYPKRIEFPTSGGIISASGGGNRFLKFSTTGLFSDMPYYFDFTDVNLQPDNFMTGKIQGVEKFKITRDGKMVIADGVATNEAITLGQLNSAISGISSVLTPALQQVLVEGNNATIPININLPEQPYNDIPYGALSVSTAGFLDANTELQTGIAIMASAPTIAIEAYAVGIPGQGVGIDAQGNLVGGSFYSNEGSGISSYGLEVGVFGNSASTGGSFAGNIIGVQGVGQSLGVNASGGDWGVWAQSPSIGILSQGASIGVQAEGETGVIVTGSQVGINAYSEYGTAAIFSIPETNPNGTIAQFINESNVVASVSSEGIIGGLSFSTTGTAYTGVYASAQDTGVDAYADNIGVNSIGGDTGVVAIGNNMGILVFGGTTGLSSTSVNGVAGVFNTRAGNTSNIVSFNKNDITLAAIKQDGKMTLTPGSTGAEVVVFSQLDTKVSRGVNNATTVVLNSATLNSTYPTATTGFRVYCSSITVGAMTYEKTVTGWLGFACIIP